MLDPAQFAAFIHPASALLPPIAQSALAYHGSDHPTPGIPSNPRMQLARLWLQQGTYLDYWTGAHEPSLSSALRALLPAPNTEHLEDAVPPAHRAIFPQLLVTPDWPPVIHVHGSEDSAVPADSSRAMHARLCAAKVESVLRIAEGSEHSFDLKKSAEAAFGELFDEVVEFLRVRL